MLVLCNRDRKYFWIKSYNEVNQVVITTAFCFFRKKKVPGVPSNAINMWLNWTEYSSMRKPIYQQHEGMLCVQITLQVLLSRFSCFHTPASVSSRLVRPPGLLWAVIFLWLKAWNVQSISIWTLFLSSRKLEEKVTKILGRHSKQRQGKHWWSDFCIL